MRVRRVNCFPSLRCGLAVTVLGLLLWQAWPPSAAAGDTPCAFAEAVSLPASAADPKPALAAADTKTALLPAADPKPARPSAGDSKHLTALFLVARGDLPDPNFGDSEVLVLNDLGPAPVGIIINRPTRFPVSSLFPDLKSLARVHDKVYFGGPVEIDSVWFLFRAAKQPKDSVLALEGVYLSASRELLLKLLAREKPMDGLRIYVGHSGWAPGQLEGEIAHGDWKLEPADAAGLFKHKSEHPWPSSDEGDASPKNDT